MIINDNDIKRLYHLIKNIREQSTRKNGASNLKKYLLFDLDQIFVFAEEAEHFLTDITSDFGEFDIPKKFNQNK